MKTRIIGKNLQVAEVGLGCMGMSEFYGPSDDSASLELLSLACDLGVNFLDTADMYGPHHNEELIGKFLATNRDKQIKVATKFGIVRNQNEYKRSINNSREYTREACNASLRRLGVEQIDLYYVHRVDTSQPIEETVDILAELVREGKIARIGLSEVNANTLRRAHSVYPIDAVQSEYSLWERSAEDEVIPTCKELGIGFVAYSPLSRGFLTGRFRSSTEFSSGDFRANLPRFSQGALQANLKLVDALEDLAEIKGCTPAQLCLAWLLAKGEHIVPIPGTRSPKYLTDNVKAADIKLTEVEILELEHVADDLPAIGERYSKEGMKGVNV